MPCFSPALEALETPLLVVVLTLLVAIALADARPLVPALVAVAPRKRNFSLAELERCEERERRRGTRMCEVRRGSFS